METNQEVRQREWLGRGLAVLVGLTVGWVANDKLGSRYVLFQTGATDGVATRTLRMNTHTGETWRWFNGPTWIPIGEQISTSSSD